MEEEGEGEMGGREERRERWKKGRNKARSGPSSFLRLVAAGPFVKLSAFLKLTNMYPFASGTRTEEAADRAEAGSDGEGEGRRPQGRARS